MEQCFNRFTPNSGLNMDLDSFGFIHGEHVKEMTPLLILTPNEKWPQPGAYKPFRLESFRQLLHQGLVVIFGHTIVSCQCPYVKAAVSAEILLKEIVTRAIGFHLCWWQRGSIRKIH